MSLRISAQNGKNSSFQNNTNSFKNPSDAWLNGSIYIRPHRFISMRPRSPFRKYEQCVRNSFRQKNFASMRERIPSPSPSIVKQNLSLFNQHDSMASSSHDPTLLKQHFRTDLTINLTNLKLQKLAPFGSPPSPKVSVSCSPREKIVDETQVNERETPRAETEPFPRVDNKPKMEEEVTTTEVVVVDKEPIRRMKIDAELLLLKINEISEKRSRLPNLAEAVNRNNKHKSRINQKQTAVSQESRLLYFRNSAFLLELINHPIVKKQKNLNSIRAF